MSTASLLVWQHFLCWYQELSQWPPSQGRWGTMTSVPTTGEAGRGCRSLEGGEGAWDRKGQKATVHGPITLPLKGIPGSGDKAAGPGVTYEVASTVERLGE